MSKKKNRFQDLTVLEDREALCPHFDMCGGCTYQKISYEKQLDLKAKEVKELLDEACFDGKISPNVAKQAGTASETIKTCETGEYGQTCYEKKDMVSEAEVLCGNNETGNLQNYIFEGIIPSPSEQGYRNKMEFAFGDECKDGPFALGLHQRGSFMNIVNIRDCRLVHDDLNKIRNAVHDYFEPFVSSNELDFHNKKTHKGWLRHLLLRRGEKTGEIMAAIVTTSEKQFDLSGLCNELLSLELEGEIKGILHIINDSLSDVVKADEIRILYGRDYIFDEVLNLRFKISVFSFFQTNTRGAELLYGKAREYAKDAHGTLFDLYSGTGTIAQLMSPSVDNVVGVEIVEEAVLAAKENAELNGIKNASFVAADVLKAVDILGKPDSLILDPPREGINPKALGKILSWGVEKIVYISCKPTSLARDLKSFKIAGYEPEKVCCVDMFPQTVHVETVVLLSKVQN